jgi:hypothetical protein
MCVDSLIHFFNSVPDYVGEGVLTCVLTIVSALIVGWITARYFMRRDELTRVEGILLEKKIPIYEHISQQLIAMNALWALDPIYAKPAVEVLKKHGIECRGQYQIHQMLLDPKEFRRIFLDFEKYTMDKKLYFDESVVLPIIVFTNYLALLNQLGVHFEHELESLGVQIDDKIRKLEEQLYAAIGLLLKDDIAHQIGVVDSAIMASLQNLSLDHRKQPQYDHHMFIDPNGPVMKAMGATFLSQQKDLINAILLDYIAMAMLLKQKK